MVALTSARATRTRVKILDVALDLFERDGYEATTTAQIAAAAGVTPMTFFRHFPTKASVVVSDLYDPVIADAVGAEPRELTPLERARRGMLAALGTIGPVEDVTVRRRVALAASHPSLRAAVAEGTMASQLAIVERLVSDGADEFDSRVAAGACLGAATAALLAITDADGTIAEVVSRALELLRSGSAP